MNRSENIGKLMAAASLALSLAACGAPVPPTPTRSPTFGEVPGLTMKETASVGDLQIYNGTDHKINPDAFNQLLAIIRSVQSKPQRVNEYTVAVDASGKPILQGGKPQLITHVLNARIEPVTSPRSLRLFSEDAWSKMTIAGYPQINASALKETRGFTLHAFSQGKNRFGPPLSSFAYVRLGPNVATEQTTGVDNVRPLITELCQVSSLGYTSQTGASMYDSAQESFCNGLAEVWDATRHELSYDQYLEGRKRLNQERISAGMLLPRNQIIETALFEPSVYQAMQKVPVLFNP